MCHGQMLGDALRKARKPHKCGACGASILPGLKYRDRRWEFEGEFGYAKICIDCATRGHVEGEHGDRECHLFVPERDSYSEIMKGILEYKGFAAARRVLRAARNAVLGK